MRAPVLWIFLPAAVGVALFFLRQQRRLVSIVSGIVCIALAVLAIALPSASPLVFGPITLNIQPEMSILGRQLVITASERPLLAMLFAFGAFWFFGSTAVQVTHLFPPLGMTILAVFVASLAVQPFLFSALLVEMAVLLSIPLLAGQPDSGRRGLQRYLIFMTLGMPFILLAGWILGSVEVSPSRQLLLQQTAVLLGLGFAFWLAIFPFYTWLPLLVEESSPFVAGFFLSLLSTIILLLAANFLNGFTWLREASQLKPALLLAGIVMTATAGLWAALQRNLARLMGYAIIAESGYALLCLALVGTEGMQVFASAFLPRLITLALWSLALTVLQANGNGLWLKDLHGLFRRAPLPALALVLACFSSGGLPLLAGFPVRYGLFALLAGQEPFALVWGLLSSAGFLFAGFRMLSVYFLEAPATGKALPGTRLQRIMVMGGVGLLLLAGLLPHQLLHSMQGLLNAFPNLLK